MAEAIRSDDVATSIGQSISWSVVRSLARSVIQSKESMRRYRALSCDHKRHVRHAFDVNLSSSFRCSKMFPLS